jgi:hypothetical protein
MSNAHMKTISLLCFGLMLAVQAAVAEDFSGHRETNQVIATDTFLISNMSRPVGSRHAVVNLSNLLESLMDLSNWPAAGAGEVTTAQLNAASNAVWSGQAAYTLGVSNIAYAASNALRGDLTSAVAYTLGVSNIAYAASNALRSDITAGVAYTLGVSNIAYAASNALRADLTSAIGYTLGVSNIAYAASNALRVDIASLDTRVDALEAASSGGSSNMPVATLGTLFITNRLARGVTNLVTDTPAWRLDGPGYAWMSLTGNTLINIVAPAADATFAVEGLLELVTTGAPPASVILSNAVAMNELVLRPGTNNLFRVLWNRTNVLVWSLQDLTTGSGAVVLSNAPTIVNATLVTPILPAILTNQISSVIGTVAGIGGANTNFTLNWQGPADLHIDAGTTNVNIVAVMNWLAGQSQVINVLLTNRTGTPRKISASAVTNNWIGLGTITLPIDVTNAVYLSIKSLGNSNTVYGARYCSNPTN